AVQCDAPSKRGRKAYDDRDFISSLTRQTTSGRDLSPAQKAQVDRLVIKYSVQIPDFELIKPTLGLETASVPEDVECSTLLDLLKHVTAWRPPSTRGKKTFSDQEFCESLRSQFARKRMLSPRQKAVLRRVVMAYKHQIPGVDELAARYEWKTPGRRGEAAGNEPDGAGTEVGQAGQTTQ
ncbi:MAG: hypothetical protein WCN95_16885, partial [bacterium]